ncbi:MAG: SET domain-containing protein [Promethearchaeota archaeon]|jgi:SET domain-containing protein
MRLNKSTKIPYNRSSVNPIEEYTEVGPSLIHGFGLFAKKFIPKNTVFWHARPQDVLIMTKEQFLTLQNSHKSPLMNDYLNCVLTYSYYEKDSDTLVFCLDDSRYINHSPNANSGTSKGEPGFVAIADRDIQAGEEITEDYTTYKFCPWLEKYRKFSELHCW